MLFEGMVMDNDNAHCPHDIGQLHNHIFLSFKAATDLGFLKDQKN